MAKKITYNNKPKETLVLELAKLREELGKARAEKRKSGKALGYRTTRKNIARVMTALQQLPVSEKSVV